MPFFTAAATAIAATLAITSTTFIAATAFALQIAAGLGLNLIAAAIKGKPKQEPVGIQGKLGTGGDIPRSFILGTYNTAGSLLYHNAYHMAGDTPNALYAQVVALSDLPVGGIAEYWLDGEKLTIAAATNQYGAYSTKHVSNGDQHLWFRFYDGTQTTADAELVSGFGSSERPYGSDRIGTGMAYVVVTALMDMRDKENPMFKGLPQCKFTVNGLKLYDPSRDSTVGGSGSHRWSDPATWGGDGDDLPAVQIYNILRGITYNGAWLYGLQKASPAILPVANWIAAINKCRALVDGPDGLEAQYRSAAQVDVNIAPADLIESLLKTCNGRLTEVGGVYTIHVGEPDSPALSFTDGDILSTEEQTYQPFRGLADSINGVVAKYPEPMEGWNVKTSPVQENPAQRIRDGGRVLMADVDLAACPYHGQVQRLLKSALREALRERRHTLVLPPWAQCLEPGDVIEWTSERNGYVEKWFRIDGMAYKANLDVMIQITEVDPSDYDWSQADDYVPPVFAPMEIIRPAPQPIVAWYAEGQVVYDAQGLPRRPVIYLSWDGNKQDLRGVAYEISTTSDDTGVIIRDRTDDHQAGSIIVGSQAFIPGQTYYARGRYIPSAPRDTPFSDWLPAVLPDLRPGIIDWDAATQKQVTDVFAAIVDGLKKQDSRMATVLQQVLARTAIDKKAVRSDIVASSDRASAGIIENREAIVTTNEAVATLDETVFAEFDNVNASVSQHTAAIATLDGYAAASWGVVLDVNGAIVGSIKIDGSASNSTFTINANNTLVTFPGVAGGAAVPVWAISNVNGVAKIVWRGDMVGDGQLLARMIAAGQIQAVHITAQSIDSTKIAIGGVDILNLIAGAATKVYTSDTVAYANPPSDLRKMIWLNANILSQLCIVRLSFAYFNQWTTNNSPPSLSMTMYVDGTAVKTWTQELARYDNNYWVASGNGSVEWVLDGYQGNRSISFISDLLQLGSNAVLTVQDLRR